jgi:hypothetical protein
VQLREAALKDDDDLAIPPELDRRKNKQDPDVGGAAPPTNEEITVKEEAEVTPKDDNAAAIKDECADTVALGREAWLRRKAEARASWDDWVLVGKAIQVGHEEAKRQAGGKATGKKYSAVFHPWLKDNGFLDMDKDDRSKLLWLVNRLPEIEAWRATRSKRERALWNHPYTVYMKARCKDRGMPEYRENETGEPSSNGEQQQEHQTEQQQEHQTKWAPGRFMLAANKAMGHVAGLRFKGWRSPEPPTRALVERWWVLARAVTNIANELDEASGLSAEDLPRKVRINRELATSCFLTEEECAERPPLTPRLT